ncbi:hypothetical protein HYFRA_00002390 [Hymenoscyphus fraxineus]|uniref:HD/PDEase domain-containing protein n=1 Tax=Hymenoscyphus fraxineus TaxID=746836 RepID=A0A9N9LAC1_9HELO|nr:hypothetical protein HYFRA_00002390 [Hymenoscyphus fraxineus]
MTTPSKDLIKSIKAHVKAHMDQNDASHDFHHIRRVVTTAHKIYHELNSPPQMDLDTITLAALLHDINDRKYLPNGTTPGEAQTMISTLLVQKGASQQLADKIQDICHGVSYTTETSDVAANQALGTKYPELAVVQDADRLDSMGAVGIGRLFTFGGARTHGGGRINGALVTKESMQETMRLLDGKLLRLVGMMKTVPGARMGREREKCLRTFREWWVGEVEFEGDETGWFGEEQDGEESK